MPLSQPQVCFYEAFEEEAKQLQLINAGFFSALYYPMTIQESGHPVPPSAIISVRTQSVIPPDWAHRLHAVLSRSTGYDHLLRWKHDTAVAVPCGYLPRYCHRAVAEQAMLLWTALMRKLPLQQKQFAVFHRDGLTGLEIAGKTILVVGVGNIGTEIIAIARGLQMNTLGVDIRPRQPDVTYVDIDAGLAQADIIVCAMNLTARNSGYFSYERLSRARRGVIFINIARGELSPCEDLLKLLEKGHLGGVGLDVYADESRLAVALRSNDAEKLASIRSVLRLAAHPNVILTPHNAFNTAEAVIRKSEQSVQQLRHFLAAGQFIWPVPAE